MEDQPNVLLLMVDALRPDRLHCYGNTWETSPAIDRIASEGVLFEQLIAHASHTLPAVGAILTGLDPLRHGISNPRTHANHDWGDFIPPLEILRRNGMVVGGFNAFLYNHFGTEPNIQDFDEARPFLEQHRDKPFFLWQFMEQVHLPYNPPPPYDTAFLPVGHVMSEETARRVEIVKSTMIVHPSGRISQFEQDQLDGNTGGFEADMDRDIEYERSAAAVDFKIEDRVPIAALYDGEVRTVDDQVGQYVDTLERLSMLDNTIVIVTSDHGEELLERGNVGHSSCSLSGTLYEEAIRVPLLVRYPPALPGGKRITRQVSQVDIMPTIFDLLGLRMPAGAQGRSLLPLVHGRDIEGAEETFAETLPCGWQALKDDHRRIWCVRTPKWKLVFNDFQPQEERTFELYDLESDPDEKHNVLGHGLSVEKELRKKLHAWMATERQFGF